MAVPTFPFTGIKTQGKQKNKYKDYFVHNFPCPHDCCDLLNKGTTEKN
jgi:hypothetical protein